MNKKNEVIGKIGVYQITNKINGHIYIGSSKDIGTRWTEHQRDLRCNEHRNKHLQNAYNKYGKENFKFEILELLESEEQQYEREQYWIDKKDACNKKVGYNIQKEVLKVPKLTKKIVCLETGEVYNSIKEAGTVKGIDPGSISTCANKKSKLKCAGKLHWRFYDDYINMSKEEIEETINNKKSFKIICIDTGEIFNSYRETGLNQASVQSCCSSLKNKKYRKCKGKMYMYLKDYEQLNQKEIDTIKALKPSMANSGEVVCLETGEEYENASSAASKLNIKSNNILKVCYGKAIAANGMHWKFKKDYVNMTHEDIQKIIKTNSITWSRAVVCLENNILYNSILEASKKTGIDSASIINTCKQKGQSKLHFMYKEDYDKATIEERKKRLQNIPPKNHKQVKCVETGEVFSTITQAAKKVKDQTTNISRCCKDSSKTCKGYHWQYVDL